MNAWIKRAALLLPPLRRVVTHRNLLLEENGNLRRERDRLKDALTQVERSARTEGAVHPPSARRADYEVYCFEREKIPALRDVT
jgi:regulator of replication initiation timing